MCLRSAVAIALISLAAVASAEIYRWTDANGKVHFGDRPPPQVEKETVEVEPTPVWRGFDIRLTYSDAFSQTLPSDDSVALLDGERIEQDVNRVYRFFDQILFVDFYRKVPVSIHVLANQREYRQYLASQVKGSVPPSLGVYLHDRHQIVVYLHPSRYGGVESTYRTIKHETSHAILASIAQRMPAWLNEGLAEQMEMLEYDDQQRFVIHQHGSNRQQILAQRQLMPVREFVEINNMTWRRQNLDQAVHQAMAGQLVYLSLSKNYGRSFITRLVQEYKRGYRQTAYYLLDEHYIGGGAALNVHWQAWRSQRMTEPSRIVFN
ncbi:DUF4124 domain-containing protein [Bacterioplanes sanyensis]|nr:DUF4124 domain-containing protein [Bacterioplanes sanyensis]